MGSKVLTALPPSVSRLSRQCGILNISQAYRPSRPVTGTAFTFFIAGIASCNLHISQKVCIYPASSMSVPANKVHFYIGTFLG
jgi:hypothetical protein